MHYYTSMGCQICNTVELSVHENRSNVHANEIRYTCHYLTLATRSVLMVNIIVLRLDTMSIYNTFVSNKDTSICC